VKGLLRGSRLVTKCQTMSRGIDHCTWYARQKGEKQAHHKHQSITIEGGKCVWSLKINKVNDLRELKTQTVSRSCNHTRRDAGVGRKRGTLGLGNNHKKTDKKKIFPRVE